MTAPPRRVDVPDALGGAFERIRILENTLTILGHFEFEIFPPTTPVDVGDDWFFGFFVKELNGYVLDVDTDGFAVAAAAVWVPSASDITIQINNVTQATPMLSDPITIDAGDLTSYTAAVQPTSNGVIAATGDRWAPEIVASDADATGLAIAFLMAAGE